VRELRARHPNLRLIGWGTSGIGLTHIIEDAKRQTLPERR